jgi:hypothetical protein
MGKALPYGTEAELIFEAGGARLAMGGNVIFMASVCLVWRNTDEKYGRVGGCVWGGGCN